LVGVAPGEDELTDDHNEDDASGDEADRL